MFKREIVERMFEGKDPGGAARCALPFLRAASWGYGIAVRTRAAAYRAGLFHSERLPAPVVSVGNLTVGGSGKTPLVIELAGLFTGLGCRVGVLSRGYGGEEPEEPLLVSDGEKILCDDPARTGDEPILIALRAPKAAVVVCRSRARGGRHAIDALGCDLLLLDDGFQHLALQRDFDIVAFRSEKPFGNGKLLPRGPMREPFSALSRAHLLVEIAGDRSAADTGDSTVARIPPGIPQVRAAIRPEELRTLWGAAELPDPAGSRVCCFSGIGSPEGFERSVEKLGGELLQRIRFPDHHAYGPEELRDIWARAREAGTDLIVTTEKDGVKVRRILERETGISLPAIPAAELAITLDLPAERILDEIRTRLSLPVPDGGGRP